MSASELNDRFEKAEDAVFEGRLGEAALALAALRAERPRDARVWFLLGLRERAAGRALAAARHLLKARALDPREPRRHLYLIEALLRAGRVPAALSAARKGWADCPPPAADDAEGLILRYRLAHAALRPLDAAAAGEALLSLRPGDRRAAQALAWPVFHEHFELFRRPPAYEAARAAALAKAEAAEPGSPWLAYFRILALRYPRYGGARRARDFALVRAAAPARYGWMRWEARIRSQEGDEGLASPEALAADLAAAKAAGFALAEHGVKRRL